MRSPTVFVCALVMAGALSMSHGQDERGIIQDVLNDVFAEYKKSLSIFSEVFTMIKNKDSPVDIIKNTIHKHPEILKNTNIWTAVCKIPIFQKIDYVGPVCTFIDTYANKVIELVDSNKELTGMAIDKLGSVLQDKLKPKQRIIGDVLGDVMNEYKKSLVIFSEMAAMIKNGDGPAKIIKATIHKYPHVLKNTNAFTGVCKIQTFQKIDYVGPVCTIIDQYANKLIGIIGDNKEITSALMDKIDQAIQDKPKTRAVATDRGFIGDVLGDVFSEYKKSLSIFTEIAAMMKNGDKASQIIKTTILNHPSVLKNTNAFTAVCRIPTLQKIDYVGPVCTWIDTYANKVITLIGDNKEISSSLLDKIDQVVQDKVNKPKTRSVDRNVITDVLSDVFNYYKKQLGVFKEVAGMMKDGKRPAEIIKSVLHKYPDVLKNSNLFTGVCKIPTLQKIDYVGPVCTWIDTKANDLIALIDNNKEITGSLIDRIDQIYG